MSEERVMILKMLKEGKITVEEAEALIDALSEEAPASASGSAPSGAEAVPAPPQESPPSGMGSGRAASLGDEIRNVVRKALEGVRPPEGLGRSMREVGRTLREELRGAAVEVDLSLHDVVHDLFGLASASEDVEITQPAVPGGRLVLRNPRGDVRLVRGSGGEIRVRAHKQVWWRTSEEARSLLGSLQVRATPTGQDVIVEPVVDPEGRRMRFRVDMTVEVPEGIGAEVDVKSGDVHVEGLTADLEARIASGDLIVGKHRGSVRATVKSGDVKVTEAESLEVQVASGDVNAGRVTGSAQVRVASGDVSLEEVRGAVQALVQSGDLTFTANGSDAVNGKVLSGDVEVRLNALAPGARVNLEVLAGDLEVELASTIRAALRAEATAGDIDVDLPLQNPQKSRRRVEGILGSADATIELRVLSGDLSVGAA